MRRLLFMILFGGETPRHELFHVLQKLLQHLTRKLVARSFVVSVWRSHFQLTFSWLTNVANLSIELRKVFFGDWMIASS